MRKPILAFFVLAISLGWMHAPIALGQSRDWPWLGVVITDVNGNFTGSGGGGGSYVTGVDHAGPASSAGLMRHDIIIAIDGRTALNPRELTCLIQGRRPGDIVSVTVMRAGQPTSLSTTLGRWPDGKEFPRPAAASCGKDPVSSGPTLPFPYRRAALPSRPSSRATCDLKQNLVHLSGSIPGSRPISATRG